MPQWLPMLQSAARRIQEYDDADEARTVMPSAIQCQEYNQECWRHVPLKIWRYLGTPTHHCEQCYNALATTSKGIHCWFYVKFDNEVASERAARSRTASNCLRHEAGEPRMPSNARRDGPYLRSGGIVTLPMNDKDCLRLFREGNVTHQIFSDRDCRRMLEIIQADDEVRAAGDRKEFT